MVLRVMLILELLSVGKWHEIEELLFRTGLNERKFQESISFLGEYDFVMIDETKRRVKINKDFQKLLTQNVA